MFFKLSDEMQRDIEVSVRAKSGESRVIDVFGLAEEVQMRFMAENVALEDIASAIVRVATQFGCALELDGEGA